MNVPWKKVIHGIALLALNLSVPAQEITTQHNDNNRTGQNLQETVLNTSNVTVSTFGKLFSRSVDGQIYAQPLYVPSLSVGGTTHNVVLVATENNSVYAFDADDPNASAPLWHVSLGTPAPSSDVSSNCFDITPQVGITSTPVIDTTTNNAIYVVSKTKNTSDNTYHFKLHALDITTGMEKFGGPVEIQGSVPGTGWNSSGGSVSFSALLQNNRPGLLLMNGTVYVAFGGMCEIVWHGWLFGYSASSLTQVAAYNTTPNGSDGGIWGGGEGLVGQGDYIYFMTGNGNFDANSSGRDYGDSVVKVNTSSGITPADYFTPYNQATLNTNDTDLGSGAPMALPYTSLIVGAGKDGIIRLINTNNMGGFNSTSNGDVQEFRATTSVFMGAPIYWSSPNYGPLIYLWGGGDYLKAFKFNGSTFQTTPVMKSSMTSTSGYSNSSPLSLSSNGSEAGSAILWASSALGGNANLQTVTGILRAFDATNISTELWDSQQNATRDSVGNYAKFSPPTVANGKVYLGTFSNRLLVYGLLPSAPKNGIQFVQVNSATPRPSATSVVVSYPSLQTPGNLNIVAVGWNDAVSNVVSVTDSTGNTYTLAGSVNRVGTGSNSNALSQAIYYAKNIAGNANTVTVTFNEPAPYPDVRILEYKGVNAPDMAVGSTGSGATSSSGPATTTAANELLFAANMVYTGTKGAGSGFTARVITSPDGDLVEDEVVGATGTYTATAPLTSSGNWVMQMATFKSTSSSTAPTVSSVSPNSGPPAGGTAVTISGTNFAAGAVVTFGGTPATNVTEVSGTSITANTPAHAAGTVNVVVTNSDSQSGTLTNGFTYTSSTAIKFVQVNLATPHPSASSVALAFTAAQNAGDLNIVVVGWNDTTSTLQSVSDSAGNTYYPAGTMQHIGSGSGGTALSQAIYYATSIAGGANTVTVTFNQAAAYPDV
ncbi:MAG TPA: IPT/TIG domain-containing protein, partial [Terriglobales bacterium]|nr:IPT/TIG domain-containing protein [Terriglobales bacterium]